jgi:hypothetical protein
MAKARRHQEEGHHPIQIRCGKQEGAFLSAAYGENDLSAEELAT